jgi:hypothetical protein
MWKLLQIVNLASAFYCVGAVWLAQADWQLWPHVGRETFPRYHLAWWHSVWWSIFPVAELSFLGICAQLFYRPPVPAALLWLALAIQLVAYAGTALWWGRGQATLEQAILPNGEQNPRYTILVRTHWLRVLLFSLAGLLQGWIAALSFLK